MKVVMSFIQHFIKKVGTRLLALKINSNKTKPLSLLLWKIKIKKSITPTHNIIFKFVHFQTNLQRSLGSSSTASFLVGWSSVSSIGSDVVNPYIQRAASLVLFQTRSDTRIPSSITIQDRGLWYTALNSNSQNPRIKISLPPIATNQQQPSNPIDS